MFLFRYGLYGIRKICVFRVILIAQPVSQFLILNSQFTKFPEFFRRAAKRQQIHQRHVILVIGCQSGHAYGCQHRF